MSNYLAIATVTAVFGDMIGKALARIPNPSGIPRVRFGPPQPDPQFVGCSLFLYGVSLQAAVRRNAAVVDANYLLTFAGDEETLEPQRFLGASSARCRRSRSCRATRSRGRSTASAIFRGPTSIRRRTRFG